MASALAAKVTEWWGLGPLEEALAAVVAGVGRAGGPYPGAWQPVEVCDPGPCCET